LIRTAFTAVALLLIALPGAAGAATFRVSTTADPQPGACAPGGCSLREAVLAANANGSTADTVTLGTGVYYLTRGQLPATSQLTLRGAGARRTTIDPSRTPRESRTLDVKSAVPVTVTVASLKITGGDLKAGDGGGIFLEGNSTLNLINVAIYANEAFNGAGVRADGTLNVIGSTFFANHALGVDKGNGPALAFLGAGRGRIVNSTFVGNHGPSRGGAIDFSPSLAGTLSLINDTVADNHADKRGGGIAAGGRGTVLLKNTIVARNTVNRRGKGANCFGRVRSLGHNLEGPAQPNPLQRTGGRTCPLHARGDRRGREPWLGRTRNNGGPTDTRELLRRSPARNRASGCPRTDQRGHRRGRRCDIGAFEFPR
jgi:CSLREA domain-containing protein